MTYSIVVYGFDSGLNELLAARFYDFKDRRYHNFVKQKNDALCNKHLRDAFRGLVIEKPIIVHYKFFCKDKRRDRINVASAFEKSFADSLQQCGIIKNDGWNDYLNVTYDFAIDKTNPRVEILIEESDDHEMFDWSGKEKQ